MPTAVSSWRHNVLPAPAEDGDDKGKQPYHRRLH
jgi:hypothetical protein